MTTQVQAAPPVAPFAIFRSAAWTAASQIATMGAGASMGIILLLRFGKSTQTDAALAAAGVYGLLLVICIGFRITIAPRLAERPSLFATFDEFLGASISLVLVSGIVLVALGGWVAAVMGGRLGFEAQETIRVSLAILWVALIAQLVGALGAALLGVRGEFGLSGLAYVLGATGALVCIVLLPSALGVIVLPVAIAVGSALMAATVLARMVRLGYAPYPSIVWKGVGELHIVRLLLVASISPVAWQLSYLISLAVAARLGTGAVTLYTYSFAAAGIVTGITANSGGLVLAGQLAQTWDRRRESLDAYLQPVLRAGLLITVPVLALAAWIGPGAIELLLGRSLSQSDARTIVVTFLMLAGMIIATMAVQVPMLAAFALSWYGRIAFLVLVTAGIHLAITLVAAMTGDVSLLGLAASISATVALLLIVGVVCGRRTALTLLLIGRESAQLALVCAAAFGPFRLVAIVLGGGLWDVPLAMVALSLFGVLIHLWLPEHYALAARITRQVLGAERRLS